MLDSLHALRFFAALMVVVYHLTMSSGELSHLELLTGFGYTGVSFFFILSGFVLTWSHRRGQTKRTFYYRRVARVWPLHFLTTLLAVGTALLTLSPINWKALPFTLTLTQALIPRGDYQYAFNGVSWSLSAEAFFYAMFPLILWFVSRRRSPITVGLSALTTVVVIGVAVTVIMPPGPQDHLLYAMPLYRIGEFVIGVCLAVALRRGWRVRLSPAHAIAGTVVLYTALVLVAVSVGDGVGQFPRFAAGLWMVPGYAVIIVAAASRDIEGGTGWLQARGLVGLGKWSFALYLIHQIVISLAGHFTSGSELPANAVAVAVIGVSIGLSGLLYRFVETPAEKAIRRWAAKGEEPVRVGGQHHGAPGLEHGFRD